MVNRIIAHMTRSIPIRFTLRFKRLTQIALKPTIVLLAGVMLMACQSGSFNDTAYPYSINTEKMAEREVKKLIIAHVNFGNPSKSYLHEHESKVDSTLKSYLEKGGYQVESNEAFQKAWRDAVRKYGEPYSTVTSQINTRAFQRVMYTVISTLKEQTDIDAVVFTDLIERQVAFGNHLNRAAKWDGVMRKPKIKGGATGVSQGFDWTQTIPAVSLSVTIYDVYGTRIFQSIGGMLITRQLDPNRGSNGRFVRRDKLFTSASHIREGVGFALHPFVPMKKYPKK